mmetsp:Transcript_27884/g.47373  ORF Transcript_27884/g.47373 Transcript_27884/m.47373 type:complete len:224 (+) Transcript_27884:1285-1956(+)
MAEARSHTTRTLDIVYTMDAYALMKEYTCSLCGRLPNTDIVFAEDGLCYHRKCMHAYILMTKVDCEDIIISPVTKKNIGCTLITPKTIKCLIEKLSDDKSSDLCASASQIEDEISEGDEVADLSAGDLLARRGLDIYFGCNNKTKNQSIGFELLVEAASEGGSAFAAYKLGSMYFGVHGFKVDAKRSKRWLMLAKELSTRSNSLGPIELENIESYLNKLLQNE